MNLALLAPEITLLALTCVVLLVDLYAPGPHRRTSFIMAQLSLLVTLGVTLLHGAQPADAFGGSYVNDLLAVIIKVAVLGAVSLVLWYGHSYLKVRELLTGEYLVLTLFGTLGVLVLASGGSLLTLYLGLEVLSLSSYALVATQRDSITGSEAAIKYFFLGALASGLLLYGISLLYGLSGTLDLAGLSQALSGGMEAPARRGALALALALVVAGLGFKLGTAPFHMWVPDVYHGAPTPVTLFLGTASKLGALALTLRLLTDAVPALAAQWQQMLMVLVVLSLAIGNVAAIAQTNLKRMLAYSTVAHMGFFVLGLMGPAAVGPAAALFYMLTYALTALAAFGMVLLLSRAGFEADAISDFRGLAQRAPWAALAFMVVLFSLAGVPPTVGFYAKLAVIGAAVDGGLAWLAVYAVLASVVGAFYYLRVIKVMYFDAPEGDVALEGHGMRAVLAVNGALVLALGLFPGPLLALCRAAFAR